MSDSIRLCSTALECPDAKVPAFYAEITGGSVTFADDSWTVVKGPNGHRVFAPAGHPFCLSTWDFPDQA
jgi:hypothetical protein